jgi:tetratricopeptide (TPR) repeat protein
MYQRYLYESLGKGERRLLHGEIGSKIEDLFSRREDQIESLAYHFLMAEDWEKAWSYQVEAGKRAQFRFASDEAITYYSCALDLSKHLLKLDSGKKAELHILIADIYCSINQYEQALAELALALSILSTMPGSPDNQLNTACIYHKMGQVLRNEGKYPEAVEVILKGLENLPEDKLKMEGALRIAMASALTRQGELEAAQDWCQQGMELVQVGGDLAELAHAYSLLGTIRRDLGDTAESLNYRLKSLEISEEIENIPLQMEAHNNLAVAYFDLGQLDQAASHYNQSRDLSQRIGNLNTTARAEINLGEVELIRGDWDEAKRAFQQALEIWDGTGYQLGQAYGACNMGAVLISIGEIEQALEYLGFSEEAFDELGAQSFLPGVYRNQAVAYQALGDLNTANDLVEKSLDLAVKLSMRQEEGAALRVLGMIYWEKGEVKPAVQNLETSVKIFQEAGVRYEEARSNLDLADLWLNERKFEQAKQPLKTAIETFETLGARADLEHALLLKSKLP